MNPAADAVTSSCHHHLRQLSVNHLKTTDTNSMWTSQHTINVWLEVLCMPQHTRHWHTYRYLL